MGCAAMAPPKTSCEVVPCPWRNWAMWSHGPGDRWGHGFSELLAWRFLAGNGGPMWLAKFWLCHLAGGPLSLASSWSLVAGDLGLGWSHVADDWQVVMCGNAGRRVAVEAAKYGCLLASKRCYRLLSIVQNAVKRVVSDISDHSSLRCDLRKRVGEGQRASLVRAVIVVLDVAVFAKPLGDTKSRFCGASTSRARLASDSTPIRICFFHNAPPSTLITASQDFLWKAMPYICILPYPSLFRPWA